MRSQATLLMLRKKRPALVHDLSIVVF